LTPHPQREKVGIGRVSKSDPPTSSSGPGWLNSAAVVALITVGGGIAVALISGGNGDDPPPPTQAPTATAAPAETPTAAPGLALLSPGDVRARASSTLARQGANTYAAGNTIDGDPTTAWSEGRDGPGIGATVTWTLRRRADLRRVSVINGYAKADLWARNLRIRGAKVTTVQGSVTATLRDTDAYQRLQIRAGPTDFVRLEIRSVYGSPVHQDCLLSEAEFQVREA
jgi:hypothetical protein